MENIQLGCVCVCGGGGGGGAVGDNGHCVRIVECSFTHQKCKIKTGRDC